MTTEENPLLEAFSNKIIVLDGAMGTAIQQRNLNPEDFGDEELEGTLVASQIW